MPAFTGPVQIFNIGGGVVQFGDTAIISPKSNSKSSNGSGSGGSGAIVCVVNGLSTNPTVDANLIDQPTIGNN